MESQDQQRL